MTPPLVVGIGGSNRPGSTTEKLLVHALDAVAAKGVETILFGGEFLSQLAVYDYYAEYDPHADRLLEAVAKADGVILGSPGYHGGLSGLVKNGLDHLEGLSKKERPYLDGRPVGTIISAAGWQACGTALVSLRSTVHSLRGWPTPFGATVNTAEPIVGDDGAYIPSVSGALGIVAQQVVEFIERGRTTA